MSAPTFGSIGTKLGASGSTPAFAVPAGVAAGDIIVVAFYAQGSSTTISAFPSGFAEAENSPRTVNAGGTGNHCIHVAWKRATGNDSGTYSFTLSAAVFVYGNAVRYTGCLASGNPWDSPTAAADGGNSILTTAPAVSITTLGPDRMLFYVASDESGDGGTWTQPAGMTQRQGGANATNCEIADLVQAATGSSGSLSATITAGGADRMGAWLGALIGTTASAAEDATPPPKLPAPLLFELAARNQATFQSGTTGVANADATLAVTAAVTPVAASTKPVDAVLTGVATLTAAAASTKPVDAALTAAATVTPAATTTKPVDSALAVTATVTPAAALTKPIDAALSTAATIAAAASATKPVDAALTATATITAAATIGAAPVTIDAAPTFTATVTPAAATSKPAATAVATTATVTAAAATTKPAQAALAATATVTAAATVTPAVPRITPRPNTGTTSKPGTGITPRPFTGITAQP